MKSFGLKFKGHRAVSILFLSLVHCLGPGTEPCLGHAPNNTLTAFDEKKSDTNPNSDSDSSESNPIEGLDAQKILDKLNELDPESKDYRNILEAMSNSSDPEVKELWEDVMNAAENGDSIPSSKTPFSFARPASPGSSGAARPSRENGTLGSSSQSSNKYVPGKSFDNNPVSSSSSEGTPPSQSTGISSNEQSGKPAGNTETPKPSNTLSQSSLSSLPAQSHAPAKSSSLENNNSNSMITRSPPTSSLGGREISTPPVASTRSEEKPSDPMKTSPRSPSPSTMLSYQPEGSLKSRSQEEPQLSSNSTKSPASASETAAKKPGSPTSPVLFSASASQYSDSSSSAPLTPSPAKIESPISSNPTPSPPPKTELLTATQSQIESNLTSEEPNSLLTSKSASSLQPSTTSAIPEPFSLEPFDPLKRQTPSSPPSTPQKEAFADWQSPSESTSDRSPASTETISPDSPSLPSRGLIASNFQNMPESDSLNVNDALKMYQEMMGTEKEDSGDLKRKPSSLKKAVPLKPQTTQLASTDLGTGKNGFLRKIQGIVSLFKDRFKNK